MEKLLRETLELFGLTAKEVSIMLACYKLGPSPIHDLAKRARIKRSTAYILCEELIGKGLLEEDLKTYKKTVSAIEPKRLYRMFATRQRALKRHEMEFEEKLPELQAQFITSSIQPKVRVFQGIHGLHNVWEDILTAKTEILLWTNQQAERSVFSKDFHEKFIKERVRKNISIRVLAVHNNPGKKLLETDEKNLRQSKLLPIHTSFSAETYLYDNKIATLDYNQDIIGVIIESAPICSSYKSIFEMTWVQIK